MEKELLVEKTWRVEISSRWGFFGGFYWLEAGEYKLPFRLKRHNKALTENMSDIVTSILNIDFLIGFNSMVK